MEADIQVEIYTVEKLRESLSNKNFWFQNVAPITKHRAQLIINSPRSNREDPVLFIAKSLEKIVGYRLIFPDRIYFGDDYIRLGWGSCFWVDKSYRGKGIGKLLFQKSLELWNGNIGSLIQSEDAARVYEGSSLFYCFRKSVGYQFILKLNSNYWVEKRIKTSELFKFLFRIADTPVNWLLTFLQRLWLARTKPLRNSLLEYYKEITDEETIQFVELRNHKSFLRKGIAELNAIVRYPTSLSAPLPDIVKSRYFFSTKANRFDYFYFKLYDASTNLKGVVLINVEGKELRLLYYFPTGDNCLDEIFGIVLLHAIALDIEIVTSYDERLNQYILQTSRFPRLYGRKHVRKSFLPIAHQSRVHDELLIFDGDGA